MNIAFIPIRSGSKGIKDKNIKFLAGHPLFYWTVRALEDCGSIDKIVIALDSLHYASIIEEFSFKKASLFWRSQASSNDNSTTEAVLLEWLNVNSEIKDEDNIVLCQVTNPFVKSKDFENGLALKEKEYDSILSVCRYKRFFWKDGKALNYNIFNRPRRQDFEGVLIENGAFYISSKSQIIANGNRVSGSIGLYEMPEYSLYEIDEPEDWVVVEQLLKSLNYDKLYRNERYSKLKVLFSDVDGVLTDGCMYYSEKGDEQKKFNTYDSVAFNFASSLGLKTALLTSENTKLVERRANKMKMDFVRQGVKGSEKLSAALEICDLLGVSIKDCAYIGDDDNCLAILENVGFPFCPANASPRVKSVPNIKVLDKKGGEGVIRELMSMVVGYEI
tara:strand:+ start:11989 stop:13155 length:1167 start_codon:yes stop_codon:yes gene_type:complete